MTTRDMTAAEKLKLISLPFLRAYEIRDLLGKPDSSTRQEIKRLGLKKFGCFGYQTEEVIKAFHMEGAIRRWKAMKGSDPA